ncbi:NAD(P)H-dependent oxidoreductase [Phenylobacterium sp.]|uniref:NAD(P)H-dependent oxidoreductase n=1 Tax=Phenylobacterium sp. TaxID=1871053 RepID=UPI0035AF91A0
MKHAVIVAHPSEHSLALAVAHRYIEAVGKLGHTSVLRDLYRMDFDPRLKAGELPVGDHFGPAPDIVAEREAIADADVFAFVYPFWFNAPPAMIKGYVDRVFSIGFGFEAVYGGTSGLLEGRKMISFTTSGAPERWVHSTGAYEALMTLFDRHVAAVCGMTVVDHVHEGGVIPNMTDEAFSAIMGRIDAAVAERFGPNASV